ncbi:MAG: hypothetical protein ACI9LU_000792, partial [Polaribacter sp.]
MVYLISIVVFGSATLLTSVGRITGNTIAVH